MSDQKPKGEGSEEERLAEQVAELAERIARGESPDVGHVEAMHTGGAGAIERLLPAIRMLSELADEEPTAEHAVFVVPPAVILGDFQLGREIGRGGIGVVYEAVQLSLGRRVAVKVLPPASQLDPRQLRRFEIEARAAASLQHPNIVPVYSYGNECGTPFIAMRRIDGRNLADVVRGLRERGHGGLPPREVAELGRQAAEALDYAHRNEVFHRDVKPSNLLVDADHRLWIADFGLARVRGLSDLTATGDVIGTVRYLSPEQAAGRRGVVDGRSDVYSLGATLYELLTLRPVFEGDDRAEILLRVATEEPRFSRRSDAAIPVDLRTIVLKALAKDPAERYSTAGELAADLTLFLARQPIRARPPTPARRAIKWARRHAEALSIAALVAAMTMGGLVAASLWSNSRLRSINRRLAHEIGRADQLAREADDHARTSERHAVGAQLRLAAQAVDAGQPERAQVILRDIPLNAGGEAPRSFVWHYLWRRSRRDVVVLVGPTTRFGGMALSADGTLLATSDPIAGLRIRDACSAAVLRNMEGVRGRIEGPVFSSDGSLVAAAERAGGETAPDGFSIWDVVSGRRLVRLPIDRGFDSLACAFLPGGGFLGLGSRRAEAPPPLARLWSLAGDPSHARLLGEWDRHPDMETARSAGEIVIPGGPSAVVRIDVGTGRPIREYRVDPPGQSIHAIACSRGGRVVAAVSEPDRRLRLWDGATGRLLANHSAPGGVGRLFFSPDGAMLAAIDASRRVHVIDCVSGDVRSIVSGGADDLRPLRVVFSPDSTRLATVPSNHSRSGDPAAITVWQAANGRRVAAFPGRTEEIGELTFTPGGRSLLISSRSGVRRWRLPTGDGDGERQPAGHQAEAWSVAFSPDGRTVATGSDDRGAEPTIKLWDAATSRLKRGWQGGVGTVASLSFSPDGRILASGHLVRTENVRIWEPATGRRLATLKGHTDRVRAVAFAGDGTSLATASSDGTIRLWHAGSWQERDVLRGHADTVHAVAFAPDGKTLASAGNDGDIRIWDLRSGEGSSLLSRVFSNRANLMAVAFSPDGRNLAVADNLGSVIIWDLERSTVVRTIHCDGDELRQVAFTPDGSAVAAAGVGGSIRIWDPATGQELMSLAAHRAQINGLAFSPDGSILGSVAHDGSVRLWHAEP